MNEATRSEGSNRAYFEGLAAAAVTAAALAGARASVASAPWYAAIPSAPLRVASACALFGAFFITAGLSQANHATRINIALAEAAAARDAAREAARRGARAEAN